MQYFQIEAKNDFIILVPFQSSFRADLPSFRIEFKANFDGFTAVS